MRIIKKTLLIFLTFFLLAALGFLLLLRYPTGHTIKPSQFAKRPDLEAGLPEVKLTVINTGNSDSLEAFIASGGRLTQKRPMVHAAILVEHPKGNFLIDSGLGTHITEEMAQASWMVRTFMPLKIDGTVVAQKDKLEALKDLKNILVTHAHWDHLSGARDFPDIPVLMLPEEIAFMKAAKKSFMGNVFPHQIQALAKQLKPVQLQDVPYENFSKSFDLYGDQSVIIVPLPGHTPGSMGVFVNAATDRRYLFVGDALWSVDPNGQPENRTLGAEIFSDHDRRQARETREKLRELIQFSNEITLIPTHDQKALEKVSQK